MSKFRVLIWRTIHNLIWLLCLVPLVLISGSSAYSLAKFYFFSTQLLGAVNKYGVAVESVGLMGPGNYSASSDTQLVPWIEFFAITKDSKTIICKVQGQHSIFGQHVSDDAAVVKIELEKLISLNKNTMQIYLQTGVINHCAVSKKISAISYLFICIFITTALAIVTVFTKSINSWAKFLKNRYV
jgi:hypothetical protein